jgi:N-acetylgalactosamine-6-sulfatase
MLLLAHVGLSQAAAPVGDTIWLYSVSTSSYVTMDPANGNRLAAKDILSVGTNEQYIVEDAGSGNILLKSAANSMYAIPDTNETTNILKATTTSTTNPNVLFEWVDIGGGKISLLNINLSKYVKVQGANELLKATRASVAADTEFTWGIVGGGADTDPPDPNPATFATPPVAVSNTVITMTAFTGSDVTAPIQYYFAETSGNPGGSDSGWQTASGYSDGGLSPGTQYTYTVKMRDGVTPIPNVGLASDPASATTGTGTPSEMPNIVFIFADDLGYADLGCYGHPYAKTPALDSLAAEGVLFTQAYVTGITCNPSRTGFMTARAHQRYIENTKDVGFGNHITITQLLKNHGYRIGHFGKWHIGPVDTPGTYGIDDIDTPSGNPGDALPGRDGGLFNDAIAFIEDNNDVPFYVNIWGHSTHYAVNPPAEYVAEFSDLVVDRNDFFTHAVNPDNSIMGIQQKFDQSIALGFDLNTSMQTYLGDVWSIDLNVERVLDTLEQLGLTENTIVVFSSDHGPAPVLLSGASKEYSHNMLGYSGTYRGGKHNQYEGGVRVPFIIRWPGHIDPNVVDTQNVISGMDWLPTLCSIVGIDDIPEDLDGEDVSDIWLGATRPRVKTQYWKTGGSKPSMRKGNWKLHYNLNNSSQTELYDLSIDPSEDNNVKDDFPVIAADLIADIEAWADSLKSPCDADYSGDIDGGYGVDLVDIAAIAAHLGQTDCAANVDCQCADIDQSGTVDIADLFDVTQDWLKGI